MNAHPAIAHGQRWPAPTLTECRESCWQNSQAAAKRAAELRCQYDRLEPGHPQLTVVLSEVSRCEAEAAHWRRLMQWHEEEIRIADARTDRRLPREPGDE